MKKYICDMCNQEISEDDLVRIKYQVYTGRSVIDENFYPSSSNNLIKDMCGACAKKFITQSTIDEVVNKRMQRLQRELLKDFI